MPSRNPFPFQHRSLLSPLLWPSPRFAPSELLIHQYPDPDGKSKGELIAGEGDPPPDRVILNDWSPPNNNSGD